MSSFGTLILLISNSFTSKKDKILHYSRTTTLLLLSLIVLLYTSSSLDFLSKGIGLYGGLIFSTSINHSFQLFIFVIGFCIITLTSFYSRKIITNQMSSFVSVIKNTLLYKSVINNKMGINFKIIEYSLLFLFVILGTLFLISSNDLVTLFISLELQSYGLYLISASHRDSESATGAALMYFLLGGLSSCFILIGIALLYINSGNTNLDSFYIINNITKTNLSLDNSLFFWYTSLYLITSFLLISTGLLFKISAAPFHFWSPDVYDGIPTIVTTFVAIIAKIPILILLLDLVYYTGKTSFTFFWTKGILISSLLSLIIGAVLGLTQIKIKRLYAFSTISHVGFILLALSINKLESIQSFMFYLLQYTISNLNAFIILLCLGYLLYFYKNKENVNNKKMKDQYYSPIQYVEQCKGYGFLNPMLGVSFSITLFSFIGVPPLVGFFGKQMILLSSLDNGYIFMALIAILTSVIGAVYYLKIIKQLYFYSYDYLSGINDTKYIAYIIDKNILNKILQKSSPNFTDLSLNNNSKSEKHAEEKNLASSTLQHHKETYFTRENITLSSYFSIIIALLTMVILFFMFIPSELIRLIILLTLNLSE
jgi:NADH-ubiquinone oxidoreductase chain 2